MVTITGYGLMGEWLNQRSAKPSTAVRIRFRPLLKRYSSEWRFFCFWARRLADSIAPWFTTSVFMGCVYYCKHYTHISLNTGYAFWRNVGYSRAHCSPWGQGCEDRVDIIARPAGSAFKVSSRARAAHFASNPLQTSLKALFFGMALFLFLGT